MNKQLYLLVVVLALVVLTAAACVPATAPVAPAAATSAPATAATAAPAAAAPTTKAATTAGAAARPAVPAPPTDGSRPLAKVPTAERNERFGAAAPASIKPNTIYQATIVTDKGNIVAELYPDAPQGVNNFVTLANNGFYDGLTFHRVEPGFVIQGGDPKGDGTGGPGYTIPAEINHKHGRGALAWARTGDQVNPTKASSGSQFYITQQETPFLDGQYSVFGQVITGMEIVDKIAVGDKIQRIDIKEAAASQLPTPLPPTPTPQPKAPKSEEGRPLAKVPAAQREALFNTPPTMTINPAGAYTATIKTSKGDVVIALDSKTAPKTVNNFVTLAELGFYDNMPVAFTDPALYVVSGSPAMRPDSDAGYALEPEFGADGPKVITGTVAMYPSFDPMTGDVMASGSQFFISFTEVQENETPLSLLGKVISGLDIAAKLTVSDTLTSVTVAGK
ncbi:MAG: peptidylprolyl isomerase [Anaerolineae bacterium]|nr:peptidylprolyl isomerase [Anaerolineae bacterium]